jgi:hypothetical protein
VRRGDLRHTGINAANRINALDGTSSGFCGKTNYQYFDPALNAAGFLPVGLSIPV